MENQEAALPGAEQTQTPDHGNTPAAEPSVADLQAQIAALRKESASYRTKAKTLESELSARQPALDEAQARIQSLESDLLTVKEAGLNVAISAVASQLGFHNPEIVSSIVTRDGLTADNTQEISKRLAAIAKENTWMVKSYKTDAGAQPNPADPKDQANAWFRKQMQS